MNAMNTHVLLTCNRKMDYMSIVIIDGPVRISEWVGKLNQVSKFCSGYNVINLC